ncbi:MAG: malate synthase A, partial [Dongiaceae bacterium]
QIPRQRQDVNVTAADLLQMPTGPITEAGLRTNIDVGLGYIEAWLRGTGCVPLHNLMEDAATAEISKAQVWQWLKHGAKFVDGQTIDRALVERIIGEERDSAAAKAAGAHRFDDAAQLFRRLVTAGDFVEFLTLPAYEMVD